jgi:hypothetical protein
MRRKGTHLLALAVAIVAVACGGGREAAHELARATRSPLVAS